MEKSMEALLKEIGELKQKQAFKRIEIKRRGEDFNVFTVLGLWSEEVRLHSAMLAELLSPEGSHGCSDAFLEAFIKDVITEEVIKAMVDGTIDLKHTIVTTEYTVGGINEDATKGGRIDILLEFPNRTGIIIENKIYAGDQPNQLRRYYNFGTDYFDNFILVYLTLSGGEASQDSIGQGFKYNYEKRSYVTEIRRWLEHCAAIAYDKPKVRETIIQYNHLITQITSYNMNEQNSIVQEISKNQDYLKNALLICSYQDELMKKAIAGPIQKALVEIGKIAEERISPLKVKFIPDEMYLYRSKLNWGFCYQLSDNVNRVMLRYMSDSALLNMYFGITREGTSQGIDVYPIFFGDSSEYWPWGCDYMSDEYRNWNGETLYCILDELANGSYNDSNFCKGILDNIIKSSSLLK